MEMTEVKSSNIKAIGYSGVTLRVEFKSGGNYEYLDVPKDIFDGIMKSDSKGGYLAAEIKGTYKFRKVDNIPMGKLKPKIDHPKTIKIIKLLDERIKSGKYDFVNETIEGIRSRQIAALIDFLVDEGVI